jgi:predicted nucleic acid-binding protein
MTFVDANSFLRTIVGPEPETRAMHATAAALFRAVARGEQEITTSEAILADGAFILTSKRQYGLPPADAAARLGRNIELPGLLLPRGRKRLYLRALDLWASVRCSASSMP